MLKRVVSRIRSFTLIELLITIGVITAVAVAGVLILNPVELLKQSRDSTRAINLKTMNAALGTYAAIKPEGFFGLASTTYVSLVDTSPTCANLSLPALPAGYFYHCVASVSLLKNIDGTGWLPVNFSAIASIAPVDQLPVDPINSASGGLYYAYNSPGKNWQAEIDSVLESQKYKPLMLSDAGSSDLFYEVGVNLSLGLANHQIPGGGGNPPQFNPSPSGWITDSSGGGGQGQGNSIIEVNGVFYVMAGSGKAFQRYEATSKTWTNMHQMPQSVNNGAVLVKYDNDTLFATRGSVTQDFWQYKISTDTWSLKASVPQNVNTGGALAYPGTGDSIYLFVGDSTNKFWKYSVSGNSWTAMADLPFTVLNGGAMTAFDSDNIYAFAGNSTTFYKYKISTGAWTGLAGTLAAVGNGGSLTNDGTNIYALRGNDTATFWKYAPLGDIWSALASTTIRIGVSDGNARGGLAYSQLLNAIYATPGTGNSIMKLSSL